MDDLWYTDDLWYMDELVLDVISSKDLLSTRTGSDSSGQDLVRPVTSTVEVYVLKEGEV